MQTYSSKMLPIEFWTRLQSRMEAEFKIRRARLAEAVKPVQVTIDTGELMIARTAAQRAEVFSLMKELEDMQMLFLVLGGQLRRAMYESDILNAEAHIACLRNVASLSDEFMMGQPHRLPVEQEFQVLLAQYAGLRSAGHGESVNAERQRLRAVALTLPVIGAEDTVDYERTVRVLHSDIDQHEASLQNLKVTTQMSLRVPVELVGLVSSFGIQMFPDEAPQLESPDQVAAEQAQA